MFSHENAQGNGIWIVGGILVLTVLALILWPFAKEYIPHDLRVYESRDDCYSVHFSACELRSDDREVYIPDEDYRHLLKTRGVQILKGSMIADYRLGKDVWYGDVHIVLPHTLHRQIFEDSKHKKEPDRTGGL